MVNANVKLIEKASTFNIPNRYIIHETSSLLYYKTNFQIKEFSLA